MSNAAEVASLVKERINNKSKAMTNDYRLSNAKANILSNPTQQLIII